MARTPDLERRQELLDRIIVYLAEHGLAQATLRPMARALDVSINRLVHHFGSKDELIASALNRANEQLVAVQAAWFARRPNLDMIEFYRRWWKWLNAKPEHLALVRLTYEAAALETSVSGLAGDLRAVQIDLWRHAVEERMLATGVPADRVELEGVLAKATFTGLVIDLLATGDRRRLNNACNTWLERLASSVSTS